MTSPAERVFETYIPIDYSDNHRAMPLVAARALTLRAEPVARLVRSAVSIAIAPVPYAVAALIGYWLAVGHS